MKPFFPSLAKHISLITVIVTLVACGESSESNDSNQSTNNNATGLTTAIDQELRHLIQSKGITATPSSSRKRIDINSKEAQLGMKLFYSKALGGNLDSACVTCHHPMLGGGDNLSLPIGTEAKIPNLLGPGRLAKTTSQHYDAGPTVPRNAPTTFNVSLFDSFMFHDGRVESTSKTPNMQGTDGHIITPDTGQSIDFKGGKNLVHAQARFPITSPEEMKGFTSAKNNQQMREFLAQRLGGYGAGIDTLDNSNYWLDQFREVFQTPNNSAASLITEQNISFLIGEYERSQLFINNPWKAYVDGNKEAISPLAKEGALLFYKSNADGGADCVRCHSGMRFSDEKFHNIATPQIGRGKGHGTGIEDFGRYDVTKLPSDKYGFRTPSLLNVSVTGPWTHAGAYTTLNAIVTHHLNPQKALDNYDKINKTYEAERKKIEAKIATKKAAKQPEPVK